MMNILDVFTEQADRIREHLGIKVRYSVQAEHSYGGWYDLNQTWECAKKNAHSVTRTVTDARHWVKRYNDFRARMGMPAVPLRIVRQVTQFDVVE